MAGKKSVKYFINRNASNHEEYYFGSRATAYAFQSLRGEAGRQPGQLPPKTLTIFWPLLWPAHEFVWRLDITFLSEFLQSQFNNVIGPMEVRPLSQILDMPLASY
jgi:hypothetical protein